MELIAPRPCFGLLSPARDMNPAADCLPRDSSIAVYFSNKASADTLDIMRAIHLVKCKPEVIDVVEIDVDYSRAAPSSIGIPADLVRSRDYQVTVIEVHQGVLETFAV